MGYKCDVCEGEEGAVYCFADGAVLCQQCDNSVHGNAKAAQKHERVALSAGNSTHQCDICQEQNAVMFCSEDRALICRRCDIMIHTANAHTAKHHRTLLIGLDVGLNALPLPGETGRTEEGTSRRLRRNAAYNAAATTSNPASGNNTSSSNRRAQQQQRQQLLPDLPQQPQQPQRETMAHAVSSGNLIHTGMQSQGGAALISPFEGQDAFPLSFGSEGPSGGNATTSTPPTTAGSGAFAPAVPWQDRATSLTLAAELLGVPSVSQGFTAKDIDAAYMLGGSGDLDAGLSALLEVPDFDANTPSNDDMFSGLGQANIATAHKHKQSASDGVVPNLFSPAAKRQRA